MKHTLTLIGLFIVSISFSQHPLTTSWLMNTTGDMGEYEYYPGPPPATTTVTMTDSTEVLEICEGVDYVYMRTNGLPAYMMGPWNMNPNLPSAHESVYRFPKNPQEETGTKEAQPFGGSIGVAVNGVKLYGAGDARSYNSGNGTNDNMGDGLWNGDAWASEGSTMDAAGAGHPDGGGNYHYHATPIALYTDPSTTHSPIVAWAFDGFPIYGPYGYSDSLDAMSTVVRIETSFQIRSITDRTILPDGSTSTPPGPAINATFPLGTYWEDYEYVPSLGHLDEYNGRWCITPEYPMGTYAYFITMDGTGEPQFPYITGLEYYGVVNANEIGGSAGTVVTMADCSPLTIEEEQVLDYTIFPNPTNSVLNVVGVNGADYQIIDQLGRVVAEDVVHDQINLDQLENGVYIIQISQNNITSSSRFIKE